MAIYLRGILMTNSEAVNYLIEAYSCCAEKFCTSEEKKKEWDKKLEKFREAIAHVATNLSTNMISWGDYTLPDNNGTPATLPPYITYCNSSRGISGNE